MQRPRLILICGLPGSGKTTLAKQLEADVRAVRFSPDEWKHDFGIDFYDEERRVQLEERLWRLGQYLLTLGQSVILKNGFWAREERDELRLAGRTLGLAVELHYLEGLSRSCGGGLNFATKKPNPERRPSNVAISSGGPASLRRRTQSNSLCSMKPRHCSVLAFASSNSAQAGSSSPLTGNSWSPTVETSWSRADGGGWLRDRDYAIGDSAATTPCSLLLRRGLTDSSSLRWCRVHPPRPGLLDAALRAQVLRSPLTHLAADSATVK